MGEGVIVEKEHHFEDDSLNLFRLLKKNTEDFLEVEFDQNDKVNMLYMFYSNARMKDMYMRNHDVIFINKRFT